MIKGYKAFGAGLKNRYGVAFEVGKTYHANGEIEFGMGGNGFHFCTYLSDVFRYFNKEEEIIVAEVYTEDTGFDLDSYDDDYNGYYDMYACKNLSIKRIISREEIIEIMLKASYYEIVKFIQTFKLTDEEARLFMEISQEIKKTVRYYHFREMDIFQKVLIKR